MNIEFAPISENEMSYEDAMLYCRFCTHNGHTDWRMPTEAEYLNSMVSWGWFLDRHPHIIVSGSDVTLKYHTIPVRDIID